MIANVIRDGVTLSAQSVEMSDVSEITSRAPSCHMFCTSTLENEIKSLSKPH